MLTLGIEHPIEMQVAHIDRVTAAAAEISVEMETKKKPPLKSN